MATSYTTNRNLQKPARGDLAGAWDVPVNANVDDIDTMLGGVLTTPVSSGSYDLSTTAYKYAVLRFTGALAGDTYVTLPAKSCIYTVDNRTTNGGASYCVQLRTGVGDVFAVPQGVSTDIFVDATGGVFPRDAPAPGTFWDWGGIYVPRWIPMCSKMPWLVCDGTTYNMSDYPHLGAVLGSTWGGNGSTTFTVPSHGNRARVPIHSSPILTATYAGIAGSSRGYCGSESNTLSTTQMPTHSHGGSTGWMDRSNPHSHPGPSIQRTATQWGSNFSSYCLDGGSGVAFPSTGTTDINHLHGIGAEGGGAPHANVQPTLIHGLSFIKT